MDTEYLAPEVVKGSFTSNRWGVAWWACAINRWILDSEQKFTQSEAEDHRRYLESLDPEIPHRVVQVTVQIGFSQV